MPRFSIKSRKRVDSLILCWSANCFSSNIAQNLIKKTKLINKWRFLRFIANFVSRLVNGTAVPKKISRSEQSYRMTGNSQIELCTNVRTNQFEAKGTIFIQWGTKSLPGIVKCNQNFQFILTKYSWIAACLTVSTSTLVLGRLGWCTGPGVLGRRDYQPLFGKGARAPPRKFFSGVTSGVV